MKLVENNIKKMLYLTHYSKILLQHVINTKIIRYFISFLLSPFFLFHTKSLKSVCILYLQHISIQISCISSAE